jgi:hypothetical protein
LDVKKGERSIANSISEKCFFMEKNRKENYLTPLLLCDSGLELFVPTTELKISTGNE